jgi:hypothetical protein
VDAETSPLFIHFKHENWKSIMLKPVGYRIKRVRLGKYTERELKKIKYGNKVERKLNFYFEDKIKYSITRMMPPGRIYFVFSNPSKILLAKDLRNSNTQRINNQRRKTLEFYYSGVKY